MTLWPVAVTPTRLPAAPTSAQIICAPVYVLPEPGGPWMASTVSSSSTDDRTAKSTAVSPG